MSFPCRPALRTFFARQHPSINRLDVLSPYRGYFVLFDHFPRCMVILAVRLSNRHRGILFSSSSYYLQYALHMRSIIYCFGGVCAVAIMSGLWIILHSSDCVLLLLLMVSTSSAQSMDIRPNRDDR